jgi:hypothetical protein
MKSRWPSALAAIAPGARPMAVPSAASAKEAMPRKNAIAPISRKFGQGLRSARDIDPICLRFLRRLVIFLPMPVRILKDALKQVRL